MDFKYMFLNFYYTYFIKINFVEWSAIGLVFIIVVFIELSKGNPKKHMCVDVSKYKLGAVKGVFGSYYTFIIIVTVINRKTLKKRLYNFNLFWTVKEVINNHNWLLLQEIIINIIMFIPVGLFLASIFNAEKKHDKIGVKVISISVFLSVVIEILQCIFSKGTLELDDIIYNFTGAAIGLFLNMLFHKGMLWVRKNEKDEQN